MDTLEALPLKIGHAAPQPGVGKGCGGFRIGPVIDGVWPAGDSLPGLVSERHALGLGGATRQEQNDGQ